MNPFLTASSTDVNTGSAWAQITYSFEITGPSGVQVPLDLSVNGRNTHSPFDQDPARNQFAGVVIRDPLTNALIFAKHCFGDECNFVANPVLLISTNEVLSVQMFVDSVLGLGTNQTSLDETLDIDPANTVPGAALAFSPGLMLTTPEPAALWLSLAGLLFAALTRPLGLFLPPVKTPVTNHPKIFPT